jgi:hypothetical protein
MKSILLSLETFGCNEQLKEQEKGKQERALRAGKGGLS